MTNQPPLSSLRKMGLDLSEAEVYELLVSAGSGTVGKISSLAGYSRTKVYGIFDRLLSGGWIKQISSKPKTFVPVEPRRILTDKKDTMIAAYEAAVEDLSRIYENSKLVVSETRTYRGHEVFKKVQEMLQSAKREVNIVTAFLPKEGIEKVTAILDNMKKKGVRVRCVLSTRLEDMSIIDTWTKKFDIRMGSFPEAGLIIIDDNDVMFAGTEDKEQPLTSLLGIQTKNKELIEFCKLIFNQFHSEEVVD